MIHDEEGKLNRYEGTNIDITEHKIADVRLAEQNQKLLQTNQQLESLNRELVTSYKEKELLLKEINHRIRNNLNMISGILFLESEKLEDESSRSFFANVRSRISSMSAVYDRLYQSPDIKNINLAEYLKSLAVSVFSSYKPVNSSIGINVASADIKLDVKRAGLLGLILNELIANSLKHGYPDHKAGTVNIALEETDGIISLIVSDDGIGIQAGYDETVSTGLPLVRMLAKQAEGTLELHGDAGTAAIIKFRR